MGNHSKQPVHRQSGPLRKFFNTPKGFVLATLVVIMGIGSLHPSDASGIKTVAIAMTTGILLDIFVGLLHQNNRWWLGDGGAITGLIIGLVVSTTTPWSITVLTTAVAIASKHLLKMGRKPIFNPAAFGLLIAICVFHTGQSWWGDLADLPPWCIVFLIIVGYLVTSRVNKFPQVLTFLGTYFALLLVAGYYHFGSAAFTPGDALRNPIVNSTLFLAFFMLTDPPTSPGKYKEQVIFSMITAVLSVGIYLEFGGLAYLLIGLLAANGWKSWKSRKSEPAKLRAAKNQVG